MKAEWAYIPFEDVCVSMTKGPFGSDIKKSLFVPKSADTYKVYIQVNAIEKDVTLGEYYITREYFDSKMSRFEVKPGDYIITCDGTLGRYLRLPQTMERGIISASLLRLTLKTNIFPRFFEYLWDGYLMPRLTSDIRNSALVHLPSATKIGKVLIPLPSLAEQSQIASELDLLSGIIDKQKAQLIELDTLSQAIFYDMFGDPVENEKGWNVKPLGELCIVVRGGSPRPIEQYLGGTIPWIKIGDATKGDDIYLHQTKEHILESGLRKTRFIHSGSLIFANCGVSLGFARIITFDGCIHDGWLAFDNISEEIDKVFLLKSLNFCTSYFRRIAPDGTQPNLNTSIMKSFLQIIPPLPVQKNYVEKIQSIEKQKETINKAIKETQALFDYTMDKYFG